MADHEKFVTVQFVNREGKPRVQMRETLAQQHEAKPSDSHAKVKILKSETKKSVSASGSTKSGSSE
jgi:hypothetical protein